MTYDAVVIGAGPGGYQAALELTDAGLKTLLVEKVKEKIGGTCLNEGCIPAKNYLQGAEFASKAAYFADYGLDLEIKGLDLNRLRATTDALKLEIRSGVVWLLDRAGVDVVFGTARFVDAYTISVAGQQFGFKHCIIATGSRVNTLTQLPLDGNRVISSTGVFELTELPDSIAIIGGGAIGCEFASFFCDFGVKVTLIVRGDRLLKTEDLDVSKAVTRDFKKRGISVLTGTGIQDADVKENGVTLHLDPEQPLACDLVLCATGRVPNTEGLEPQNAGVALDDKGFIAVNASLRTSLQHIYAIGDCIPTLAYAHVAHAEARIASHNIIHQDNATNTHVVPTVIFCRPQIAGCGINEQDAKAASREIVVKKAWFKASAKAKILGDDAGFVKLIACARHGTILGASIIGVEATEIIHELVIAVENEMTVDTLKSTIHAHPTVAEIVTLL